VSRLSRGSNIRTRTVASGEALRFGLQAPRLWRIFAFDPALSNDNEFISQRMVGRVVRPRIAPKHCRSSLPPACLNCN